MFGIEEAAQRGLGGRVPAGVDDPEAAEIEPKGQGPEPAKGVHVDLRALSELLQERLVLGSVLGRVRPQVSTMATGRSPGEGVQLMVAHNRDGSAGLDHAASYGEHVALSGAAVDEVAGEDDLTAWVPKDAILLDVSELGQQAPKGVDVAVDVTDDVEAGGASG